MRGLNGSGLKSQQNKKNNNNSNTFAVNILNWRKSEKNFEARYAFCKFAEVRGRLRDVTGN